MKTRHTSLRFKLMSMSLGIVVLVCFTIAGTTYQILNHNFEHKAADELEDTLNGIKGHLALQEQDVKRSASFIAQRPDLVQAIVDKDSKLVRKIALEISTVEKLDVLTISDEKGIVLGRGHSETTGDSVINQSNVRIALQGRVATGYEAGTAVKLALRCGQPVLQNGKLVGVITTGMNLSSRDDFVDLIKANFGIESSIFSGTERVSTTLTGPDGKRAKGTKLDTPAIVDAVLNRGELYLDLKEIKGAKFQYAIMPLKSPDAKTVGMLGLRAELSALAQLQQAIINAILWTCLGAVILSAVASLLISNRLGHTIGNHTQTIRQSSSDVLAAATQVGEASQTLAGGVSSEAASLQETSASIEELVSMTKRNSESAEKAASLTKEARRVADAGGADTQAMSTAMQEIKRSSDDIAKIIKTIDEIAFQTNILALNAAVEAARAGEAGAGFAVVAEEVRNLAHRSAEAAKQTASQIDAAISQTNSGVDLSVKVITCLQALSDRVREVDALVAEVSGASKEQSQGLSQLNVAVASIDRVTQASAASSEETAAAARELTSHAQTLSSTVDQLNSYIKGS